MESSRVLRDQRRRTAADVDHEPVDAGLAGSAADVTADRSRGVQDVPAEFGVDERTAPGVVGCSATEFGSVRRGAQVGRGDVAVDCCILGERVVPTPDPRRG